MIFLKKENLDMIMNNKLLMLSKSKFRSSFKLKEKDINYINEKGLNVIREHARDFIIKRLSSKEIINDGKQTPMRGHPVFIAQHATATCCRKCLCKWHNIKPNKELTNNEINYIINIIMMWIEHEYKKGVE